GRILTCGATAGFEVVTDACYLWPFEHRYIGSNGCSVADLESLLGLIRDGRLKPVIDRVLPLAEAAEGERLLEEREVIGKVLLKPSRPAPCLSLRAPTSAVSSAPTFHARASQ